MKFLFEALAAQEAKLDFPKLERQMIQKEFAFAYQLSLESFADDVNSKFHYNHETVDEFDAMFSEFKEQAVNLFHGFVLFVMDDEIYQKYYSQLITAINTKIRECKARTFSHSAKRYEDQYNDCSCIVKC